MLETFCDMNLEMARTGNFSTQIGKEQLLRLVAHNNVILARASPCKCFPLAWSWTVTWAVAQGPETLTDKRLCLMACPAAVLLALSPS